ncbi:hypothetical protein BX616_000341 [Lobosporangium transversale]|nr:hypothetical protein BX616_000341 [Lobosporangium transversale]
MASKYQERAFSFSSFSTSISTAAGQRLSSSQSFSTSTCSSNGLQQQVSQAPERTMGLMSAILMTNITLTFFFYLFLPPWPNLQIIGTLIGTGIFASPGPLFDSVNCTQTSFMIWAFAGIICTIGAFAYAELGTMFPESGGDYQYLARAYGKKMALVFGWSFITILNPIGTAGISGVLGRYAVDMIIYFKTGTSSGAGPAVAAVGAAMVTGAGSVLNGTNYVAPQVHSPFAPGTPSYASFPNDPLAQNQTGAVLPSSGHSDDMPWVVRSFSIGSILVMGMINIFFLEGGKYASNILAMFKIGGMCMLIVIGSMQAAKNHAQSEAFSIPIEQSSHNISDYVSALCFAFFAYNGFNNINLGLGELRDPERNLKRAVWIAMPFVTILFLLANFAFFSILSSHDLRHVHSLSLHAGHTVLGQPGGFMMAGTVVASALGSINANIWAGSRLLVIMAKDNAIIPYPIGKVWARTGTQATAMGILVVQASIHALISLDFKTFSKIYSAVGWTWYGLSILGLLYLRKKKPTFPRPVKVFWPLALVFVMVAFFLVFGSLTLAFMSTGISPELQQSEGSKGEPDDAESGRYTPVIMFGMAILFMTGVVPAFYLTKCFNRRQQRKRATKYGQSEETLNPYNNTDGQSKDPNGHAGALGCPQPDFERKKLSRRFSSSSSITLVIEQKKIKKRQYQQHQQLEGSRCNSPQPAHFESDSDDEYGDNEKEIARVQELRSSKLSYDQRSHNPLDDVEMGGARTNNNTQHQNSSNNNNDRIDTYSPFSGPVMAITIPSPEAYRAAVNSPYRQCPSQFLDIHGNGRSGPSCSEITLSLADEYVCSTNGEDDDDRTKEKDSQSQDKMG